MRFSKIIAFFLIFIGVISILSAEKMVVRFEYPSQHIVREFNNTKYDVASYKPGEYLDIVVTGTIYEQLLARGLNISITQTEEQLKNNLRTRELDGYTTCDEVSEQLLLLSVLYPEICELYVLGDTWGKTYYNDGEGNDNYFPYDQEIWGLKVSDNVSMEEDEPNIYYTGAHHAREPISTEVTMAVLDHIVANYGTDPTITDNVDNTQIWFIPMVNPNGRRLVIDEVDVWWRKNIRDNNENGQLDEEDNGDYVDGVDPNRNYGFEWGLVGASDLWENQTYHGPEPLSEPGNQVMEELINSRHFVAGINYHSHGELILFPFGYNDGTVAPDQEALEELAVEMAEQIPSLDYGHYTPEAAWLLYPCMGTMDDHAYGTKGIFSFTIELATQFIPPAEQVPEICEDNLNAALTLLNRSSHSILTGHITNNSTGQPLVAEIFIEGIDDTGAYKFPYLSNEQFGTYYRLLTDGVYNVTFSYYGFESQTFTDVEINSTGQTILDVALNPVPFTSLSGEIYDATNAQPIEGARLTILDSPLEEITTNEAGEYLFPEIPVGHYQIAISATGYVSILQEIDLLESENILNFVMEISEAESFESEQFGYEWSLMGDADWFIDNEEAYDGFYSARSGNIGSSESTSLIIVLDVVEDDIISFYKKVSCEDDLNDHDFDFFTFSIDNVELDRWDGEDDWSEEVYAVSPGLHTFEWKYQKDGYISEGSDCAWIDYVNLPEFDNSGSENTEIPLRTKLISNYPNPFNPSTTISYYTDKPGNIEIDIYNVRGRNVKTIDLGFVETGKYTVQWNGEDNDGKMVTSGIYIGMMRRSDYTSIIKMILLK